MPDRVRSPALEPEVLLRIPLPEGWAIHRGSFRGSMLNDTMHYRIETQTMYRSRSRDVTDFMRKYVHQIEMIGYMAAAPVHAKWNLKKGSPSPHRLWIEVDLVHYHD